MAHPDFEQLRDAYAAAWETRQQTGNQAPELLFDTLAASGLGVLQGPGPVRDAVQSAWDRGVPPRKLERALRRAMWRALPGITAEVVTSTYRAFRPLFDELGKASWEVVDDSWQDLPDGHRRLTDVRRSHDLALRRLHPPVDRMTLDLTLDEAATELAARCRGASSPERPGWGEAGCWLLPDEDATAQVMVGAERLGWTALPHPVWELLGRESERSVFADGLVRFPWSGPEVELVCFVPRAG